jgi:hypothetical protein
MVVEFLGGETLKGSDELVNLRFVQDWLGKWGVLSIRRCRGGVVEGGRLVDGAVVEIEGSVVHRRADVRSIGIRVPAHRSRSRLLGDVAVLLLRYSRSLFVQDRTCSAHDHIVARASRCCPPSCHMPWTGISTTWLHDLGGSPEIIRYIGSKW